MLPVLGTDNYTRQYTILYYTLLYYITLLLCYTVYTVLIICLPIEAQAHFCYELADRASVFAVFQQLIQINGRLEPFHSGIACVLIITERARSSQRSAGLLEGEVERPSCLGL